MTYYINQGLSNEGDLMLLAQNLKNKLGPTRSERNEKSGRVWAVTSRCDWSYFHLASVLEWHSMRSAKPAIKLRVTLFDMPMAKFRVARTYHLPNR